MIKNLFWPIVHIAFSNQFLHSPGQQLSLCWHLIRRRTENTAFDELEKEQVKINGYDKLRR